LDPERLRMRAQSHQLIYAHAINAGLTHRDREMQRFSRTLFLLSRQCGAAGLSVESRSLFDLARAACGAERRWGIDFVAYRCVAGLMGWHTAGKLSMVLDALRHNRANE